MKISDILRMAADAFDQRSAGAVADSALQNRAELSPIDASTPDGQDVVVIDAGPEDEGGPAGVTASGNDKDPEIFLPPLQQKQELLKKAVGVENIYDDGTATEQAEQEEEQDDMSAERQDIVDRIKKLSGVPVAAIQ